jgi:hypothetical protein
VDQSSGFRSVQHRVLQIGQQSEGIKSAAIISTGGLAGQVLQRSASGYVFVIPTGRVRMLVALLCLSSRVAPWPVPWGREKVVTLQEELHELFASARWSVFRLETLDWYTAEYEQEPLRKFLAGEPVRLGTPQTSPYLRLVQDKTSTGVVWQRVHVVSEPLTDYVRYEMAAYRANVLAGEEVRIARRTADQRLTAAGPDFWMIDDRDVAVLRHDEAGRLLALQAVKQVSPYRELRTLALEQSRPLEEFGSSLPPPHRNR